MTLVHVEVAKNIKSVVGQVFEEEVEMQRKITNNKFQITSKLQYQMTEITNYI